MWGLYLLICLFIYPLPPDASHLLPYPKVRQNKFQEKKKKKEGKRKKEKILLLKIQCDTVSLIANPFIHVFLQADVYSKESLVWFVDLGLCYTINTGSSLGLF